MKNSFIQWLKPSFEGVDGKASARTLSAFFILVVFNSSLHFAFIQLGYRIAKQEVITEGSLKVMDRIRDLIGINHTVTLILFGIITMQLILSLFRSYRNQPDTPQLIEEVTKTSKTTTVIKQEENEKGINTTSTDTPPVG